MTDLCPRLDADLVVLHPLRVPHADVLFPILKDQALWQFTESKAPETLGALQQRFLRLESRRSADGEQHWLNWAIEEKTSSRIAGFVQATVPKSLEVAEIAYVLGRAFWGKGLALNSARTLLEFLRLAGVGRIQATVDSRNLASVKLLKHLAFSVIEMNDPANTVFELAWPIQAQEKSIS